MFREYQRTVDRRKKVERPDTKKDESLEPKVSDVVGEEGFTDVLESSDEARKAVFSRMSPGEFHMVSYPEGDIAVDAGKTNQIHTVLYKSPDGKLLQKTLTGENYKYGWTAYAAKCLIRAMETKSGPDNKGSIEVPPPERDGRVLEAGFAEPASLTDEEKAVFGSLVPGTFVTLRYSDGVIAAEPGKKGYIHSIVYKSTDGKSLKKDLRGENRKYGWTPYEANALVAGLKESIEEKINQQQK
jgi:hypothetical protein